MFSFKKYIENEVIKSINGFKIIKPSNKLSFLTAQ